ncbi:MFS transporter [Aestuariispira insulae]|uniref:Putative MFS family arabinose efflux permease n=1 Tax=Aestuariispira insulae TaxID=1461337 RepID=A0A3D9HVQ9_9PROT|nr:MFS transporter [Aestuariispira insulae]RED53495.1 putative MFS family arabinose efflux permease [Aestuariispira insulae]
MLRAYQAVLTIILSAAIVACGNGMMGTYVPIRLKEGGYGPEQVMIAVICFAAGMLASCLLSGYLIRRVGHIRAFAAFASISGLVMLAMSWQISLEGWAGLRFVHGFTSNAIFMIVQSWLNERTESRFRGQIMAFFYVMYTLSYGGGALILTGVDVTTTGPLMIGCALYLAAIVPMSTTRVEAPSLPSRISIDLVKVYRLSPVGLVGAFVSGAVGMGLQGSGAVYAGLLGLAPAAISLLMFSTQAGNLVIQWPLGFLSDRLDRRYVLVGTGLAVSALTIFISGLSGETFLILAIAFAALGGCSESIYSISAAHANDWADEDDYVTLSSTILIVWSVGALSGPIAITPLLGWLGPVGLPLYCGVVAAAFALFALWRLTARAQPPEADQEQFQALAPAPASTDLAWNEEETPEPVIESEPAIESADKP